MSLGCGCGWRPNHKIVPDPASVTSSECSVVEVRPKRWLQIRHVNPQPRSHDFEKEYEWFLECQRLGRQHKMPNPMIQQVSNASSPVSRHKSSTAESIQKVVNIHLAHPNMLVEEGEQSEEPKEIENQKKDSEILSNSTDTETNASKSHVGSDIEQGASETDTEAKDTVSENESQHNTYQKVTKLRTPGLYPGTDTDEADTMTDGGLKTATASNVSVRVNSRSEESGDSQSVKTTVRVVNLNSRQKIHSSADASSCTKLQSTKNRNIKEECNHNKTSNVTNGAIHTMNHGKSFSGVLSPERHNGSFLIPKNDSPYFSRPNSLVSRGDIGAHDAVIFFLHGVGGSSDIWLSQLDYFGSEGYELVAPDLIGHGFSPAPKNPKAYTFDEIAQDVFAIFDKYCKRHNVIIGHSYGTSFATVLARKRAKWVSKLIMINGGGPTPLAPQPGVFQWPLCVLACFKPILVCGFHKNAFHGKSKTFIPKEKAFDIPAYVLKYTMNGQYWEDGNQEYHQWLSVPTLLIYGEEDQLVTIQEELEMNQTIFASRLEVIRNASHMVMMEQPHEVNHLIQEFLHKGRRVLGSARPSRVDPDIGKSTMSVKSVKSIPDSGNLLSSSLHLR